MSAFADIREIQGQKILGEQQKVDSQLLGAVKRNDLKGVKDALSSGANPNAKDGEGTALSCALDLGIARLLISKGAKE